MTRLLPMEMNIMKSKDIRTIEERAGDLEKVITFSVVSTVKKYYRTVGQLKREFKAICEGTASKLVVINFQKRFGLNSRFGCHSKDEYHKILGSTYDNGKRQYVKITDAVKHLPSWLHYQRHFTKHYKSGKHFSVSGYWYIDFEKLEELLEDPRVLDTTSDYYTQKQHNLIDKLVLGYTKKEEDHTMDNIPPLDNSDIPEDDELQSKVYPHLEAFVKASYIGPSCANHLSSFYGPSLNLPTSRYVDTSKIQENVDKRLAILTTVWKEVGGLLGDKDAKWLKSEIASAAKETRILKGAHK